MAFKKKVKLKYGEWEVPAGGQTVPNPLPLQPGASPPLLPREEGSSMGGGLKGEIISTSPLPILLLVQ